MKPAIRWRAAPRRCSYTSGRRASAAAESPDAYPRIETIRRPWITDESGLRPGDVLLRANGRSLQAGAAGRMPHEFT